MTRRITAVILLPALGAAAASCGAESTTQAGAETTAAPAITRAAAATTAATPTARRRGKTVRADASRYGRILVDGAGRTLYLFTRDPRGRSACRGACARAWPPFLTKAAPRSGGAEVTTGALGTTRRRDGTRQVTYNGHPLYYYVGDRSPGVILCQAVDEFGGGWYVVSPKGDAIT